MVMWSSMFSLIQVCGTMFFAHMCWQILQTAKIRLEIHTPASLHPPFFFYKAPAEDLEQTAAWACWHADVGMESGGFPACRAAVSGTSVEEVGIAGHGRVVTCQYQHISVAAPVT